MVICKLDPDATFIGVVLWELDSRRVEICGRRQHLSLMQLAYLRRLACFRISEGGLLI